MAGRGPTQMCHSRVRDSGLRATTSEAEAPWLCIGRLPGGSGTGAGIEGGAGFGSTLRGRCVEWVNLQYFFFPPLNHCHTSLFWEGRVPFVSHNNTKSSGVCMPLVRVAIRLPLLCFHLCPHLEACRLHHASG